MPSAEEWEAVWHPGRRRFFYQNRAQGESTWRRPADVPEPPPRTPRTVEADSRDSRLLRPQVPRDWEVAFDKKWFTWYYYNPATRQRTWTAPQADTDEELGSPLPAALSEKLSRSSPSRKGVAASKRGIKTHKKSFPASFIWDADNFLLRLKEAEDARRDAAPALRDLASSNDDLVERVPPVKLVRVWAIDDIVFKIVFKNEDGQLSAFGRPGGLEGPPFEVPVHDRLRAVTCVTGGDQGLGLRGCRLETHGGNRSSWYGCRPGVTVADLDVRVLAARSRHHLTGLVMRGDVPVGAIDSYSKNAGSRPCRATGLGLAVPPTLHAKLNQLRTLSVGDQSSAVAAVTRPPRKAVVAVTLASRPWVQALQHLAVREGAGSKHVCLVNYIDSETSLDGGHKFRPWGGYREGGPDPAAELCRHVPALGDALESAADEALKDGTRPTPGEDPLVWLTHAAHLPRQEAQGIFTEKYVGLVFARGSQEEGFPILPPERQLKLDVITAMCPVKGVIADSSSRDALEADLTKQLRATIEAIFLAPMLRRDGMLKARGTTLVIAPAALYQAAELVDKRGDDCGLRSLVMDALVEAVAPGEPLAQAHGLGEVVFLLGRSPGVAARDRDFEKEFQERLLLENVAIRKL